MITIGQALNNDLLKNTDLDSTAIQYHLQSEYNQDYDHFMAGHPVCPDCGHRLYRHDTCNKSVKIQSAQTVASLTIRRVHCPHCGRTHRVLPLFVIPSFQICSDTAAEIIQLHNSGKPVSKQSNGLVDASTAYRFLNQMKKRFSAVLKRLRTFNDLFTCSAVKIGPYLMISPGFLHFSIFQPIT